MQINLPENVGYTITNIGHFAPDHWGDNEQKRDVYELLLTKGKKSHTFRFFQSIAQSSWEGYSNKEVLTLVSSPWGKCSLADLASARQKHKPTRPTLADILECLTLHEPEADFLYFCDEYGYDNDSIKAKGVHEAVQAEYRKLKDIFSPEEMDAIWEAITQ